MKFSKIIKLLLATLTLLGFFMGGAKQNPLASNIFIRKGADVASAPTAAPVASETPEQNVETLLLTVELINALDTIKNALESLFENIVEIVSKRFG